MILRLSIKQIIQYFLSKCTYVIKNVEIVNLLLDNKNILFYQIEKYIEISNSFQKRSILYNRLIASVRLNVIIIRVIKIHDRLKHAVTAEINMILNFILRHYFPILALHIQHVKRSLENFFTKHIKAVIKNADDV